VVDYFNGVYFVVCFRYVSLSLDFLSRISYLGVVNYTSFREKY
jgi:hypothetical protein